jgi:predicted nucleotidyltransferase
MLTSTDLLIPRRLKSRLTESIPIDRFVVFGSRARGDAGSDADMDVYIEVQSLNPNLRRQISEIAWEVSLDSGVVISTLVASGPHPLAGTPIRKAIDQ